MPQTPECNEYHQLVFEGFSGQPEEEKTLPYGIVEETPTVTKNGRGSEWRCVVRVPSDLWTEEETIYELRATGFATEAKKKRLRPGDVVCLTGTPSVQEMALAGGEIKRVHQFTVSGMDVIRRAKRTSITVYEQQKPK